jgi:predicted small lipoprotein YifL
MKGQITIAALVFFATLSGCDQKSKPTDNPPMTKPVENITATEDQQERRAKSEQFCKTKNIPVYQNPNSLFVDRRVTSASGSTNNEFGF